MTTRPAEFDAALERYMPALRNLARRHAPHARREDVVQDVATYALEHWENFRVKETRDDPYGEGSGFYNWLYWQFRSLCGNHGRKKRPVEILTDTMNYKFINRHSCKATQEDEVVARDILDRVDTGREGAILLRRAMGCELHEIGEEIGLSRERVRQLEVRGRANLVKATRRRKPVKVAA
jgi:RNA polymerase sigma factor (sigma-70 family)